MTTILETLKEQRAETRKKLRAEFLALVSKSKPTPKDAARLGEVASELGWDVSLVAAAGEIVRTVRETEEALKHPHATNEDVAAALTEMSKLVNDFNEKAKEHDKERAALARKISGLQNAVSNYQSLEQQLTLLLKTFGPILGTGDKWGQLSESIGPSFYQFLKVIRQHDAENAEPQYRPRTDIYTPGESWRRK